MNEVDEEALKPKVIYSNRLVFNSWLQILLITKERKKPLSTMQSDDTGSRTNKKPPDENMQTDGSLSKLVINFSISKLVEIQI